MDQVFLTLVGDSKSLNFLVRLQFGPLDWTSFDQIISQKRLLSNPIGALSELSFLKAPWTLTQIRPLTLSFTFLMFFFLYFGCFEAF